MADYSITGDTKLDTSGFTKGVSSMTVAAGNLISDLTKTAATKLAGLAKSSVSVGMNFDASMSQVAATMGTTVDQIDNLTKVAKEHHQVHRYTGGGCSELSGAGRLRRRQSSRGASQRTESGRCWRHGLSLRLRPRH